MTISTPIVKRGSLTHFFVYTGICLGAFLAAFAIKVFFVPNHLIDGGTVGISMILSYIFGKNLLPFFLAMTTLPFITIAYKFFGNHFLKNFFYAIFVFSSSILFLQKFFPDLQFKGDPLEVVVAAGSILGCGVGLVIRYGGCLDGAEILALLINRKTGLSVGQVVMFINLFVFSAAGIVFKDWHPPLLSLITFIIAAKVMDTIIVGLEETKSVTVISKLSSNISKAIISELELGVTIMYGRGGFTGEEKEILYVIAERIQLAELKELIWREDPSAFIAIENLHEVSNGPESNGVYQKSLKFERFLSKRMKKKSGLI
jgi:uncharacterized membrane-anchored protein YitT (DUF2179 family)